ncbi:hypothetical protein R5N98_12400 [Tenacibaculum maritimum]|uniref:hypothetical protein n=1 Tax=Tenacibaculum maritimum TaxID=107401 RepID=UPI00388E5605
MIAGGLLGLGLLGYLFFRDKEEKTEDAEFTIVEDVKPAKKTHSKPLKNEVSVVKMKPSVAIQKEKKVSIEKPELIQEPNDDFPLKLGSKGKRVHQLRVYLLKNHGTGGMISDEFDLIAQERVLKYLKVKKVSEKLFQERNMANDKKQKKDATKKKY